MVNHVIVEKKYVVHKTVCWCISLWKMNNVHFSQGDTVLHIVLHSTCSLNMLNAKLCAKLCVQLYSVHVPYDNKNMHAKLRGGVCSSYVVCKYLT